VLLAPLATRLRTLRRDLATAAAALAGRNPPPVVRVRAARAADATGVASGPQAVVVRPMRVARVVRETADAVTLVLEDPRGEPVRFAAGQFFTLRVPLGNGEVAKRAYSASSSPLDAASVSVTVKRVPGGRVSTHLVETARAGDVLEVIGPSGSFTPAPANGPRSVVLVGGGSGITPLASIARTLLATEPETRVALVYGNRALEDVIFFEALERLVREHAEAKRFTVRHVLERPPPGWAGGGLLDGEGLARELDALAGVDASAEYFLCGPEPMMQAARACIEGRGVPPARVREERFVSAHATAASSGPQDVRVRLRGREKHLVVAPGSTVLEAAFEARVEMPFSCTVGGCGACRVRLVEGELPMDEPNCLSPQERAEGYVLACVSRPTGPCTLEVE
jgi:ferredoxin-NADP reductase